MTTKQGGETISGPQSVEGDALIVCCARVLVRFCRVFFKRGRCSRLSRGPCSYQGSTSQHPSKVPVPEAFAALSSFGPARKGTFEGSAEGSPFKACDGRQLCPLKAYHPALGACK